MAKQEPPKDFLDWLGLTEAPRWGAARPLGALFSVVLILLFFAALLAAFAVLGRAILRPESGGGIGAGALIVALLGAPFLIWNTVIKHKALGYQKEGLITDRIAKMVEQLGAEKTVKKEGEGGATVEWSEPNIEVRIGALYALERIAQDSVAYDKGRDHIRLMEILCTYVRHNAPVGDLRYRPYEGVRVPRLDIQLAIDVIKRRSPIQRQIEATARYRINLREADLDGVDFSDGDLTATIFNRSSLAFANFFCADLTGAQFLKAAIGNAIFRGAVLRGTDLSFAKGEERVSDGLRTANIQSMFIEGAKLPKLLITKKKAPNIFGSVDTQIHPDHEKDKKKGLSIADNRAADAVDSSATGLKVEAPTEGESLFLHWNPYEASDSAAWEFREPFKQKHDLIGWPFDDT